VADDGKGFEPEAASAGERESLGLMSLRDRAQLVGGRLSVVCRPGRGTSITVSAPLAEQGRA
jgi:signal transduction histidine kinase